MPDNNKPLVLVTGGAGKVAQLLRPELRNIYNLRLLDRVAPVSLFKGEHDCIGDLSDPGFVEESVRGVSAVIHLAAAVSSTIDFDDTVNSNYIAVLNLLHACAEQGIERFVFASSHHIQGMHHASNGPLGVADYVAPDGFYGLSKAFGEAACAMYAYRHGLKAFVIRIGNVDDEVVDSRRERIWTSASDLAALVRVGLTHNLGPFEVAYGISNCPDPLLINSEEIRTLYKPSAHSHAHLSREYAVLDTEASKYVGGQFATVPLPDPRKRK